MTAVKKTAEPVTYSKAQIVESDRYADYRDYLAGNLEDREYTVTEVDSLINRAYRKGGK